MMDERVISRREYYEKLMNDIYFILVKYEKAPYTYNKHLRELVYQTGGNYEFVEMRKVYYMLNFLYTHDTEHQAVKDVVFDAIGVIDFILSNWEGE